MSITPYVPGNPATNSSRASAIIRTNLDALFNGDALPLRPRAQGTPNMTVAVAGTNIDSFWQQVWAGTLLPMNYAGGNSPVVTAPVGNPRIDLLTISATGVLAWTTGTVAASPSPPNCPENVIPICWIYCRPTMVRIVNFENRASFPNDGYILNDVRPFLNLGGTTPMIAANFQSFDPDIFGNGSDGDVTISSNTTLTAGSGGVRVLRYNNLTINSGFFLEGNAADRTLVILVKETLTINGTIRMNARGGKGVATVCVGGGAGAFGGGGGAKVGTNYTGGGGGGGGQTGGTGESGTENIGMGGGDRASHILSLASDSRPRFNLGGHMRGRGGNGNGSDGENYMAGLLSPLPFETLRTLIGGGGGTNGFGNSPGGDGGGSIWIEAKNIVWGGGGLISANGSLGGVNNTYYSGSGAGGGIQVVFKSKTGSSNIQVNGASAQGSGVARGGAGAIGLAAEFLVK